MSERRGSKRHNLQTSERWRTKRYKLQTSEWQGYNNYNLQTLEIIGNFGLLTNYDPILKELIKKPEGDVKPQS